MAFLSNPVESPSCSESAKKDKQWGSGSPVASARLLHTWLSPCIRVDAAHATPFFVVSAETFAIYQGTRHWPICYMAWLLAHPRGGDKLTVRAPTRGGGWIRAKIITCPNHMHAAFLNFECGSQHCGASLLTTCNQCKRLSSGCKSHAVGGEK